MARQLYDAWDNIRASASSGTMPTPSASLRGQADIGYTGQRLDATGLMYYRARYYASSLGRFASADTMVPDGKNPQSWNRYSYVRNQPLKYIDPSGHGECDPLDGKCEGGPNTGGSKDGGGEGGGPQQPIDPSKRVGEQNGPYKEVHANEHKQTVRTDFKGNTTVNGHPVDTAAESLTRCPNCGEANPRILRSQGKILDKELVKPENVGIDGVSAWCEGCGNNIPKSFWARTIDSIRSFAKSLGLDPNKAAVYTPEFGGTGHYSLFTDAIGSDGRLLPRYGDLIDKFLRGGARK